MYEIETDIEQLLEIEKSIDPEIVTNDTPLVDKKERIFTIEEEVEDLEDVEAVL